MPENPMMSDEFRVMNENSEKMNILPEQTLRHPSKHFALRVIQWVEALPNRPAGWVMGKQVLRSGTAVGANERSACRSQSDKDFLARMGIVEEEIDETTYWLELLREAGLGP